MQIYNILPQPDGSWKAVLVGDDQLVISNECKESLIETMVRWAEKTGDPITIRLFTAEGDLEREEVFPAGG